MPMAPEPTTSSDFGMASGHHRLLVGPDQLAVGLRPGSWRARAPVARMMCLAWIADRARAVLARPRACPCRQAWPRRRNGDLVLLQQEPTPRRKLAGDAARALDHLRHVEADFLGGEAEVVEVVHQLRDLGRAQQRLGRDAAPVEADAAQMLALDQRRLHAELRGADRRDVAAGAAADDDQVELSISHRLSPVRAASPADLRSAS